MRALLGALWLLVAGPAAGQTVERETFSVLGWNDACSVAVEHFGYAAIGEAVQDEPVRTRIGAIAIAPGEDTPRTVWAADWDGAGTWQKSEAKKALQGFAAAGYTRPGLPEDIHIPRAGAEAILSTAAFSLRTQFPWPGDGWSWDQVIYSPVGDCGLFTFSRRENGHPFYRYSLLRFYNPSVRLQRGQAHLADSNLLFEAGDIEAALAEAATAALLQPGLAPTRYRHAALLCLTGRLNESVSELSAAVRLDAKLAQKAQSDPDFSEVYEFPRFRGLLKKNP
jgi:hypothetical protein